MELFLGMIVAYIALFADFMEFFVCCQIEIQDGRPA